MSQDWSKLLSHERQVLQIAGANIVIENGVFTPDPEVTYSTAIIIENLPTLTDTRVADVGTGSGVLAVLAVLRGAREVIATDISDKAIKNARLNATENGVASKVQVVIDNLLEHVDGNFDIVFANLPILEEVWQEASTKPLVERFLKDTKMKLAPKGEIYLVWASFAEGREKIENMMKKYGYRTRCISTEKLGYVWYLYILTVAEEHS